MAQRFAIKASLFGSTCGGSKPLAQIVMRGRRHRGAESQDGGDAGYFQKLSPVHAHDFVILLLGRLNMAIPAIGFHRHIIVAFVAEFLLVRMAVHAAVLQAHIELFAARIADVLPVIVAHHRIPPVVQKLHVFGPHELLGLHALFFPVLLFPLLDRRSVRFRFRLRRSPSRCCSRTGTSQSPTKTRSPMNILPPS